MVQQWPIREILKYFELSENEVTAYQNYGMVCVREIYNIEGTY